MNDFNRMSARLGLFYTKSLENHVRCTSIFIYLFFLFAVNRFNNMSYRVEGLICIVLIEFTCIFLYNSIPLKSGYLR